MQFLSIIGSVILFIFGLLLLTVLGHLVYTEHIMKKHGKKYCGKVIDEVADDGFDGGYGPIYDPIIEYRNDRNETKRIKSPLGTGMRCKFGEAIDVYEYKDKVFLDQRLDRCILKCGFAFFGALFIVVGVYFIRY